MDPAAGVSSTKNPQRFSTLLLEHGRQLQRLISVTEAIMARLQINPQNQPAEIGTCRLPILWQLLFGRQCFLHSQPQACPQHYSNWVISLNAAAAPTNCLNFHILQIKEHFVKKCA